MKINWNSPKRSLKWNSNLQMNFNKRKNWKWYIFSQSVSIPQQWTSGIFISYFDSWIFISYFADFYFLFRLIKEDILNLSYHKNWICIYFTTSVWLWFHIMQCWSAYDVIANANTAWRTDGYSVCTTLLIPLHSGVKGEPLYALSCCTNPRLKRDLDQPRWRI